MGWRPSDVRACSLPDFAEAVAAWNAMQAEQAGEPDDEPQDLAAKARAIFRKRGLA